MNRRTFLTSVTRAGLGAAALASLPRPLRAAASPGPPDGIIVRNDRPEHWESEIGSLGRDWITPTGLFFVRSHFPPPDVDVATWRLELEGLIARGKSLTIADLLAMPQVERAHTLECAGNGRGLMKLASTSGTQWRYGAVGNARWSGVLLAHVLERAEVSRSAKHVWFEAADQAPMPGVPRFVRSIPIEKAMDDVILALAMNGHPLEQRHGAPVRVLVPGWFGVASTKWVTKIRAEEQPSDNHFMVRGYRYNAPGEAPEQAPPVQELRVKSLITRPLDGARVRADEVAMQGFAWAGPAGVRSVEVSADGGATWTPAQLLGNKEQNAWRSWGANVKLPQRGANTLCARATDGVGNVQPVEAPINAGGYGNNSIHRVTVDAR